MPYPSRRGQGGGGFTLGPEQNVFTGANLAAAESARDTYFAANPSNLSQYNNDTSLNIRLEYADGAQYQVRNDAGDAWLPNESFNALRGEPGEDGADGLQLEFNSLANRDAFFIAHPDRLVNGLPIVAHTGNNVVTELVWNGPDNPTDYANDDVRWRQASQAVSNNSLFVGSTRVSNAVENIVVTTADGRQFLAIGIGFDSTGSRRVNVTELAAESMLDINSATDQIIPMPFEVSYSTVGDNLTVNTLVSPHEAGDLRAEYYLVTDDGDRLIFDETRTVTQDEVDAVTAARNANDVDNQFISFDVGNAYLLDANLPLRVRFSGIRLRGGLVTGGQFDGQTIIAFRSKVQTFTSQPLIRESDFTGDAVVTLLSTLTGNSRLPASAIRDLPSSGDDNVQADWNETDANSDAFIRNKPTIPTDTNDFADSVDATVSGQNLTITIGRTGSLSDLSTTVALPGSSVAPPADADRIYYGLASGSDTTSIDVSTLTREDEPTNPDTISSGVATQGQYFVLFVPMTHDITTITDTVLQQDVTDLFTALDNAQLIDTIQFKSYIIGPLNAGFNESYKVAF